MVDARPKALNKSDLQTAKHELVATLLKKKGIELQDSRRIYAREFHNNIPLSFAQERLWFLDQLEPGNSVYNICRAHRLTGLLDIAVLTLSLNEVVRRHEAMRTTFAPVDDHPVQSVAPTLTLTIPVLDLKNLASSSRDAETSRIIIEEARYSFSLANGPLFRLVLLQLGEEDHMLIFTTHQIVCDGWSVNVFFRELETLYGSHFNGKPVSIPDLPLQFADYALWQRQHLQGEFLESQLSYWKKQLGSSLPFLNFPTDRPRPPSQSFRGTRIAVALPEVLAEALDELSRQAGVTLFTILLAAFKVLLYRYTGQEDIIVGSPVANRSHTEIEGLIGFFVNSLVLRTDLSGNPSFKELLTRCRNTCLGAYAHQDLPFEKLVEESNPDRKLGRNPLFQVMFVFQNTLASGLSFPGCTSKSVEIDAGTSKFDLTLSLAGREKQFAGFFEYNSDLFDRTTIERMIGHFQVLLEGIVTDPDQSISTLPLFREAERHQLLVEWNDTRADYPKDSCIHELFEAQVEKTPEAVAVEFEGQQLTYRELNDRANQLAHVLRGLGVGPEKLVGLCIDRALEMVIGLLGILKAGGAYVSLDPKYPRERLAFMLEDAQVSVLLTQAKLVEDRGWRMEDGDPRSSILDPRLQVVFVDRDRPLIAQQSDKNPLSQVYSTDLAYVIYTSGSTGKPKGVQVSHRSVVNCLSAIGENIALTVKDVFLALTTISFDIASLELFLPLITGAKLVLASRDEALDAKLLLDRLTVCGATAMQATPSAWRLLLDAGWRSSSDFKILCGGEVLSRQSADQLLEGGASLWNLYGPTESTIWSAIAKIERDGNPVFIGRPIANTQIYILDSQMQPVPVGVLGELHIGGDGLARGYLNRPELTTEKFVANPFSSEPGARLYRTGDRARYRADGNIEFLGRVDNQVKIRGYRIELGEIETILNQHPSVKESVVIASSFPLPRPGRIKVGVTPLTSGVREETLLSLPSPVDGDGVSQSDRNLIAYLVPNTEKPLVAELRSFLKEKLPDYMIPSWFVFLDALPLTPNGKMDRNALPLPDGERPLLDQGFVEPRTEIEELVAQVWREVLKLEMIGVYDNFFELGGHSLLATRVVARLRSNFNVALPLRKLFELPTVAGLAEHIDFLRHNQSGVSVPPIMPVSRDRAISLSFSQRRLWFLHKLDPSLTAYNIPAMFRIEGDLNICALEKALKEIINRHEVLRTRIIEIDGQPIQQIISTLIVTLPVIDLGHLPEDQAAAEVQQLSADDARQPYNLAEDPLMRAKLIRLNNQEHVLILNFHHIVCDGSSLIIFYQELATLYEAFLDGKISTLPSLPVQYADYAVWQHEQLQGEVLESQLAYWKEQLGPGLATLNLPTDFERPLVQTYRGARLTKALSVELTKGLKELSRREGVTLFMTLLATLDIMLSRHTGQTDIIVGSTIAGRNRPETEGLIGFFINALALRTDLSGNPTFTELLRRARDLCLDAYTHQDLPFERVVEEINPDRDLTRNPLFQVMFNMTDTDERVLHLAGCQAVKLSHSVPEAKFDITLYAPEKDGRIELAIVYNKNLFSEARIAIMLDQLSSLLSQIVENLQQPIAQYSLVTPSSKTALPDPTEPLDESWEGSIHSLFTRRAQRVPGSLAVIDPSENWTYKELDLASNRLANYLLANQINPKDVVAIYAHRSSPLVLALLGVLKAGAAFVILDPVYPSSRLIDYLRIARPKGWVKMEGTGKLPEALVSCLDSLQLRCRIDLPSRKETIPDSLGQSPETETGVVVNANDLAYVAFTSGSTGEPKGVLGRHGPITHFLPWQEETFDLRPSDRFALVSGLGYNHLHRDVFTALSLGAAVYVPDPEHLKTPERLSEWLQQHEITILHLTPALGRLLRTAIGQTLPSVRRIFFGGDVLSRQDLGLTRGLAPHAKIVSFYGATETQRAVGYFEVPAESFTIDAASSRPIPLGRGMKDVQLLLLTTGGHLADIGELAELYVRSPHLAQGYVGDSDLTAQNFIVNPFTNNITDRLYRTGELGRYLPDGNVEWVGRNDRRVSIRGFRIELAEVESVLSRCAGIRNNAVVAKEFAWGCSSRDGIKELCLVAYVEANREQPPSIDELRCFLTARLPHYMVPSYFLFLDRLPLSPNGKVDYLALPSPDQLLRPAEKEFESPQTEAERTLAKIFSEVLGLERIGRHDNFFNLGGHSLLAAQVAARVRETLNVVLDLRAFLETPTVEGLGRQVEALLGNTNVRQDTEEKEREEIDI
jgi:amino acid adenylation domain-containing protein